MSTNTNAAQRYKNFPDTADQLTELLSERWSPRSFDANSILSDADLASLLEAARWAPSASNHQPRKFIVGKRGDAAFAKLSESLAEVNQLWAPQASALILAIAVNSNSDGESYHYADYDLGQAVAHLSVQAQALGLQVRQIGGFDKDATRAGFGLSAELTPRTILAIGTLGDHTGLDPQVLERESEPRIRKPLTDLVIDWKPAD